MSLKLGPYLCCDFLYLFYIMFCSVVIEVCLFSRSIEKYNQKFITRE